MKPQLLLAMVLLVALGFWLVSGSFKLYGIDATRPGAELHELRVGPVRGFVEVLPLDPDADGVIDGHSFRLLYRDGSATEVFGDEVFRRRFGERAYSMILAIDANPLFRILNITSYASLAWVVLGFAGQAAFFGRMAIQWVVSEKERKSVVPPIFWWLSLAGGVALFIYFVWRRDPVGVLGQSTGVVIYARNLRLITKDRRREERRRERTLPAAGDEPTLDPLTESDNHEVFSSQDRKQPT